MKSHTKPMKAQRRTSEKRIENDRYEDDIGARDKNDINTSLKGKKERMSPRNPYSPMVPLEKADKFNMTKQSLSLEQYLFGLKKITSNYKKIVFQCEKENNDSRIPCPTKEHAKLITYLLLKSSKRSIKVFTSGKIGDIYDDFQLQELLNLKKNVKIEIITKYKPEYNIAVKKIFIQQSKNTSNINIIPGYFIMVDGKSYRYEK
jgi:hypothetical protein